MRFNYNEYLKAFPREEKKPRKPVIDPEDNMTVEEKKEPVKEEKEDGMGTDGELDSE